MRGLWTNWIVVAFFAAVGLHTDAFNWGNWVGVNWETVHWVRFNRSNTHTLDANWGRTDWGNAVALCRFDAVWSHWIALQRDWFWRFYTIPVGESADANWVIWVGMNAVALDGNWADWEAAAAAVVSVTFFSTFSASVSVLTLWSHLFLSTIGLVGCVFGSNIACLISLNLGKVLLLFCSVSKSRSK